MNTILAILAAITISSKPLDSVYNDESVAVGIPNGTQVAQPSDVAQGVQTAKDYTDAHANNTSIHVTQQDKNRWNAKQDAIDDLDEIREGAAKGETAYQKPNGGIPKNDLSSSVQQSLGKADNAVQPAAISDMETKTHAASTYQPKGNYLTEEVDPTVKAWAKADTKPSYTPNEVGALPDNQGELEANENFRGAVAAVSPPVELPEKWALANVTNATGGAVSAADVGAYGKTDYVDIDNGITIRDGYVSIYGSEELDTTYAEYAKDHFTMFDGYNYLVFDLYGKCIYMSDEYGGGQYWYFPQDRSGMFALESWQSLAAMADSATNATARASVGAKMMTLIDQPVEQKINQSVSSHLNTYIDGATGVEYEGKWYAGSMYFVPTGNVYPPNN